MCVCGGGGGHMLPCPSQWRSWDFFPEGALGPCFFMGVYFTLSIVFHIKHVFCGGMGMCVCVWGGGGGHMPP